MNFKELRKRRGMTIDEASKELKVSFQSLCRYENKGRIPQKTILKKMIAIYNCNATELGESILYSLKEGE